MTVSLCTAPMSGPQWRRLRQQGSFTQVADACTGTSRRQAPPTWAGLVTHSCQGFKRECIPGRKAHRIATQGTRTNATAFLWSNLRHPEHHFDVALDYRQVANVSLDFRKCSHLRLLPFHHPVTYLSFLQPFPPAAPEHS